MAAPLERGTTTQLLNRLGAGDSEAAHELAPLVYSELHELAGALLARAFGVSVPTIERRWRLARAWLHAELRR